MQGGGGKNAFTPPHRIGLTDYKIFWEGGVTLLSHSVYYYYEKYKPYENNNKHIDMFCSFSAFNLNTTWINWSANDKINTVIVSFGLDSLRVKLETNSGCGCWVGDGPILRNQLLPNTGPPTPWWWWLNLLMLGLVAWGLILCFRYEKDGLQLFNPSESLI